MRLSDQAPPPANDGSGADSEPPLSSWAPAPVTPETLVPAPAYTPDPALQHELDSWSRINRGLTMWTVLLIGLGGGGLLLGQTELAGLAALAGLFVASQAADLDRRWMALHYVLSWVVPAGGAAAYTAIGFFILQEGGGGRFEKLVAASCFAGAAVAFLTYLRPVSNALSRFWFHGSSHTLRLAARFALLSLLVGLPGWLVMHELLDEAGYSLDQLMEGVNFGGELLGYVLLAFGAVGFMLRRDLAQTLDRLGLSSLTPSHLLSIAAGMLALIVLNVGAERVQQQLLPELWRSDQAVVSAIAGQLTLGQSVMLGLSAGIGEEITMRGALQPKLGIFWTSLLFAALHVQYSWYGMLVVLAIGCTLGLLRKRTNTTCAMAVHALFDLMGVIGAQHA